MTSQHIEDPTTEVRGSLRSAATTTLMIAAVVAENLARTRAEQKRQAEALAAAESRRMEEQMRAEASTASAQLATYVDKDWISQAQPEAIGEAWTTARQWEAVRPEEFSPYVEQLRDGVRERFGVDLADVDSAREVVERLDASPLVEREEVERTPEQLQREDRDVVDEVVAAGVSYKTHVDLDRDAADATFGDTETAAEAAADRAAFDGAATLAEYDSDARRAGLERRAIAGKVEPDVAAGRARAARSQARPAQEATADKSTTTKGGNKPRRGRSADRGSEPGR